MSDPYEEADNEFTFERLGDCAPLIPPPPFEIVIDLKTHRWCPLSDYTFGHFTFTYPVVYRREGMNRQKRIRS